MRAVANPGHGFRPDVVSLAERAACRRGNLRHARKGVLVGVNAGGNGPAGSGAIDHDARHCDTSRITPIRVKAGRQMVKNSLISMDVSLSTCRSLLVDLWRRSARIRGFTAPFPRPCAARRPFD